MVLNFRYFEARYLALTNFSIAVKKLILLNSIHRYAFAIGGQDGSEILSTVERYDPHTNAWILVAPLAIPLRFMTSISHRGKLYVFGGETSEKISKTAYRYTMLVVF